MTEHTPGPYLIGQPVWSVINSQGNLVAMQVTSAANARLIAAAPDLLAACELGDSLGNSGPFLLNYAAELLDNFAPVIAEELRRKAKTELVAIHKATEAENA